MILVVFSGIFKFNEVIYNADGKLVLFDVFNTLKNVLSYFLFFGLYAIAIGIAVAVSALFLFIPKYDNNLFVRVVDSFFRDYLSLWFSFPTEERPYFNEIPDLILKELEKFLNNVYLFTFQIFFFIAILYFGSLTNTAKTKYKIAIKKKI
jgi:hypothetical protein